jgi:hypothetical protein
MGVRSSLFKPNEHYLDSIYIVKACINANTDLILQLSELLANAETYDTIELKEHAPPLSKIQKDSLMAKIQAERYKKFRGAFENGITAIKSSIELKIASSSDHIEVAKQKSMLKKVEVLANELFFKVLDKYSKEKVTTKFIATKMQESFKTIEKLDVINNDSKSLDDLLKEKYGFNCEFAGALVLDFPTNDVYFSKIPKWGVWITPSYTFKGLEKWEFFLVARYLKNFVANDFTNNKDFGGKILYESGKFSVNGELVQRFQNITVSSETTNNVTTTVSRSTQDFKATLNMNYRLSETLVLSYSLGKNFELNTGNPGNLLSVLSLNYGLDIIKKKNISDL